MQGSALGLSLLFEIEFPYRGCFLEILMRFCYLRRLGGEFSICRARKFAEVVDMCNLMDIGTSGSQFTWCHTIQGSQ